MRCHDVDDSLLELIKISDLFETVHARAVVGFLYGGRLNPYASPKFMKKKLLVVSTLDTLEVT